MHILNRGFTFIREVPLNCVYVCVCSSTALRRKLYLLLKKGRRSYVPHCQSIVFL